MGSSVGAHTRGLRCACENLCPLRRCSSLLYQALFALRRSLCILACGSQSPRQFFASAQCRLEVASKFIKCSPKRNNILLVAATRFLALRISLVTFPMALRPYLERLTLFWVIPLTKVAPPPLPLGPIFVTASMALLTSTLLGFKAIA